ncbi:immunity 42 family protein [Proteus faecis]|uniref:Immunity 42 family protein n=1 Tax=Proteus faecis TaxID=2050967 RepID=A0AAW7CYU3_9GAMM|nr:immunity 42 family protein [Proteus faecis]MBG3013418.1 immunity 42 family protein [Proteus mirabilis]QNH66503.1 immunity 42 family protein [Proteus vulgaris]MCT8250951.1 immunity 42 family protein [Proteus faecis]MDL5167584.1 immunity 42 family protein [Proteus faecis]MDL5275530.1 immunity 42 family protein [Proteus faecis]
MIFGDPYDFAVIYEKVEESNDGYWKFGFFNFVIKDELFPAKGSNYTLHMAINYLKDSVEEIDNCRPLDDHSINECELFGLIAHSHIKILDTDPDDFEIIPSQPIGVDLSPVEISDVGFYLFYYIENGDYESLIFSKDYGVTISKVMFPKGTIKKVLNKLPDKDSI